MLNMQIQEIVWQDTIAIRHRILWPDKTPEYCYVEEDPFGKHFGAFVEGKLVCVASVFITQGQARLRKFATEHAFQDHGIGTKMLQHIFNHLKELLKGQQTELLEEQGVIYFWLDARESAMGLYRRFGMQPEGERFYKEGVPYYKMSINLK